MAKEQKILQHWTFKLQNLFAATRKAELQQMMKLMTNWLFHSR